GRAGRGGRGPGGGSAAGPHAPRPGRRVPPALPLRDGGRCQGVAAARAGRAGGPAVRVPTRPRDRRRDRSGGMTAPATDAPTLLEVRSLRKFFPVTEGILTRRLVGEGRAVGRGDLRLRRGA